MSSLRPSLHFKRGHFLEEKIANLSLAELWWILIYEYSRGHVLGGRGK